MSLSLVKDERTHSYNKDGLAKLKEIAGLFICQAIRMSKDLRESGGLKSETPVYGRIARTGLIILLLTIYLQPFMLKVRFVDFVHYSQIKGHRK